jgi:RNA polymerase sigma factor (sigma-70 family)
MNGETANFDDLLLHSGWLRRFAIALVKDHDVAEDIVQDTLVAAWQRPAKRGGRPWLARIARNFAINRWRGSERRHRREEATADIVGPVSSPEELVGDREIHRAVAAAVASLEEPFRQTLVLRFFDGASSVEMARRLGVPEGTVRWRIMEGIERVRRRLDAQHGHDRKTWLSALSPLLPRSTAPAAPSPPPGAAAGPWALHPITIAGLVLFIAGMALMGIVIVSRHHGPRLGTGVVAVAPAIGSATPVNAAGGTIEPVRLNAQAMVTAPTPEPLPGPREGDAKSLLRELLDAAQAGAYDDFVAKGSAAFKAAAPADLLRRNGDRFRERLAAGYQPTLLGDLRRGPARVWLFRLEFSDGGDDALVHLGMEGWQVAGFFIEDPQSNDRQKREEKER